MKMATANSRWRLVTALPVAVARGGVRVVLAPAWPPHCGGGIVTVEVASHTPHGQRRLSFEHQPNLELN